MIEWLKRLFFGEKVEKPLVKRPTTITERPPAPTPTKTYYESLDLPDFSDMTKLDLDIWARHEHNINLDRRQTKSNMIKELKRKLGEKS